MIRIFFCWCTALLMVVSLGIITDVSRAAVTIEDVDGAYDFVVFHPRESPHESIMHIHSGRFSLTGQGNGKSKIWVSKALIPSTPAEWCV